MSDDRRDFKDRSGGNPPEKQERKPLRRPMECQEPNKDSDSRSTNSSVSNLSPNAPEFVPRSNNPHTQPASNLPAQPQPLCNGESNDAESIKDVRTILHEITMNPEKFDTLATLLIDRLNITIQQDATIKAVVHEIVEQAIAEPNFRYNGARLCSFLYNYLADNFNNYGFRTILLQRCQNECEMRDSLAQIPEKSQRLCGLTMFIGELFCIMDLKLPNGTIHKVGLLCDAVLHLLETLIKYPTKEHIKCACQMLKLAGSTVEDCERSANGGNAPLLDYAFLTMEKLAMDRGVDSNVRDMLANVMELRTSDWGRQSSARDNAGGEPSIRMPSTNFQPGENGESNEDISIGHVRTIMYEITVNPGKFDTLATLLVDALNVTIQDEITLKAVVHEIFEQAVMEQNFRYNGARLCNYLSNSLAPNFNTYGFRSLLIKRCQQEYEMKENLVQSPEKSARLCGFTMFMGELFIHMKLKLQDGSTHKVHALGEAVLHLLETLLMHPTKELLKCACQMLKFTGAALEDFERLANAGNAPSLDNTFMTMGKLVIDGNIDKTAKDMLMNVMELRAIDWGRLQTPISNIRDEAGSEQNVLGTDPVLYGPDGLPISPEEALFLESNQYLYDNTALEDECNDYDFYSQSQGLWSTSDDVMDDEMTAAFEKFLLGNS